ncbi:hypothetical protein M432DRAFT_640646 [Thermoascus aurantiacus ATCC 26904]
MGPDQLSRAAWGIHFTCAPAAKLQLTFALFFCLCRCTLVNPNPRGLCSPLPRSPDDELQRSTAVAQPLSGLGATPPDARMPSLACQDASALFHDIPLQAWCNASSSW